MGHTALAAHGTGAAITTLGTGTHGHTHHGAITDGIMTHGTTAVGTTLGTTADTGDGTTGTATITHITADGTADGTLIIITDISIVLATSTPNPEIITVISEATDIRPGQTECSPAGRLSEAVQA